METILITGTGMVASALESAAKVYGFKPQIVSHGQMDLTDPARVEQVIGQSGASWVFHTAAMTKVNQCEENPDLAYAVNSLGTQHVVRAASKVSAALIFFSTDYVFDGTKETGWLETDTPNPLNEYGNSKLAGETHVLAYSSGHVVRTSGVFGIRADGSPERNFFKAIAAKLQFGSGPIQVVQDQFTAVTYSNHLAKMVFALISNDLPQLVHLTSTGDNSWYGWAQAAADILGTGANRLQPVPSKAVDTGTIRPAHCVLKSICREARGFSGAFPAQQGLQEYFETTGLIGQRKDLQDS